MLTQREFGSAEGISMRYIYLPTLTIRWIVLSILALYMGLSGASPQTVLAGTSISPTGGTGSPASLGTIITSGTSTVPTNLCAADCVITGGTRSGTNLYHSLGDFNVGSLDSVRFQTGLINPLPDSSVGNILARITGGPSSIFGNVDSATYYPSANLFLMNPNGFLFGPTATVNVGGMVAFTTADYLKHADAAGIHFNATPNPTADALLSTSPVAAFGFLGSNPAAIAIQGSTLQVAQGQSLSLVGGNRGFDYIDPDTGNPGSVSGGVTITGGSLSAPSGQINIVSVAAAGEVSATQFLPGNGMVMGNIRLAERATIDASGDPGGTVRIRSGQFVMDQAYIFAGSSGDIDGATTAVSIKATGDMLVNNQSNVDVTGFGAGRTGDIEIEARSLMLTDGSIIANQGFGSAPAGNISLMIDQSLTLEGMDPFGNGSLLQTFNAGSGTGGNITLSPLNTQTSPTLSVADSGKILTQAGGQSAAGDITMHVANLTLRSGASIQTFGAQDAPSGNIQVNATGDVSLIGQGDFTTRIVSQNSDVGGTGWIRIQSGTLSLTDKAQIVSETASLPGSPSPTDPKVLLTATDSVTVTGGSRIDLPPVNNARSSVGSLNIHASNTVTISDLGSLNTSTIGSGDAGAINITAGNLTMTGGGQINSLTQGKGSGGTITVQGHSVTLSDHASISASSTGPGNTGNIQINAGNQFAMTNSSVTTEAAAASGGTIKITTDPSGTVQLTNSTISASVLDGTGGGGSVNIDPQSVILLNSQIFAQAVQGPGGNISITTNLLLPDANSVISASSQFGVNGTITIQSPNAPISGQIQPLGTTPLPATSLLNQRCASLAGGEFSSFTVAGRDSLPTEPGGWLSSPLAGLSAGTGLVARGEGERPVAVEKTPLLSLRQIAPAGFLTQVFAVDRSAGCQS